MTKSGKRGKSDEVDSVVKGDYGFSSCAFEEETWSPCVAWVVGRQSEDSRHIEALNIIVQTGTRKLFSVITKEQLYLDVREFGNPKNKKAKEGPSNCEICEACKVYIDANEPIPAPMLAKLLKWKMMALKDADLKRRTASAKAPPDKKRGKEKEPLKSPKKGRKSAELPVAKEGSKLKKRGEDDDESKYIDDEPEDGAHYYIIVTGFHDPRLFQFLDSMNVFVSCVITVSSQEYFWSKQPAAEDEKLASQSEDFKKEEELKQELNTFWRDLLPLLQSLPDTSTLHDIARLDYEVKSQVVPIDLADAEQKVLYSTAIYEDIASMLYALRNSKRLYQTYLANLKLTHIPLVHEKEAVPSEANLATETVSGSVPPPVVDMRYYNDLMNTIPQESVSVPLILHCMLEQVVATEEGIVLHSEQPEKPTDEPRCDLTAYLAEVASRLGLSNEELEKLSTFLNLPKAKMETAKPPELISIHDSICIRTQHLKPHYGFDAQVVEASMLQHLPFASMFHVDPLTLQESLQRAFRLQELLHFCEKEGLSKIDTDHSLKQFVFESMHVTKCDRNGFPLKREKEGLHQCPIPWDDPYPFYKIMVPPPEKNIIESLASSLIPVEISSGECKSVTAENSKVPSKRSTPRGNISRDSFQKSEMEVDGDRVSVASSGSRKGILVASTHSMSQSMSPMRSTCNSVHFDIPSGGGGSDNSHEEVKAPQKYPEENLLEVFDMQERNLEEWCIAEHFQPHILFQVLQEAIYRLPFIETYLHRRDNSMMVILHNPYNRERQNNRRWHKELHSNMGFRNYLENVSESIHEWLKTKEAEYRAQLLSKEVEGIIKEEEEKQKDLEKAEKKGKKSPQRSASKTRSARGSASGSQERVNIAAPSNPYTRVGSLKAQLDEQMRMATEEDEKERIKLEKRKRSDPKEKSADEKKRRQSRSLDIKNEPDVGSITSATSQTRDLVTEISTMESEKYWPFHGYDTGNKFIHMSGKITTMFPNDGGTIKTERMELVQGCTFIQSVVQKDNHVFVVHITNPREDMNLPDEYVAELEAKHKEPNKETTETKIDNEEMGSSTSYADFNEQKDADYNSKSQKAVSQFGSITANLSDGMILALSQFGSTGESYLKPYEPTQFTHTSNTSETVAETPMSSPSKSRMGLSKAKVNTEQEKSATPEHSAEDIEMKKEKEEEAPKQDFQELFVTCPDGLTIKYFLQSSAGVVPQSPDERQLVVRQSYPFKTKGVQSCEGARNKYIHSEVSRIITADGYVIKNMINGTVEILSADGTVSIFNGKWTDRCNSAAPAADTKAQSDNAKKDKKAMKTLSKTVHPQPQPEVPEIVVESPKITKPKSNWVTIHPGGKCVQFFKETRKNVELPSIPGSIATDPETKQVMTTREDRVIIVNYPDGGSVVEHADGTRISVYFREVTMPVENITEDKSECMTETHVVKFVKVECPAFATVEFNSTTSENLTIFNSGTSINVFPDGYYILHHSQGGRIEIDTEGTLVYFPRRNQFLEHLMPQRELQYVLRHNADIIVEMVDVDGNIFDVHSNGECVVIPVLGDDIFSSKSFLSNSTEENKASGHNLHAPRYFIIYEDGSGTELLRYHDVAEYLVTAEQNPAAAVLKERILGRPGITGITVLKPYLSGLSEKWFKNYEQDSIIPKGLRCRDLKTLQPRELKKPGPKFGTNVGRGLSIGNFKAPVKIPILKCPEKLEFRQLVQHKLVTDQLRSTFRNGLHEYGKAVVERMMAENLMTIKDPRPEAELISAEDLQSLADLHKPEVKEIYSENIKEIYEEAVAIPETATPQKKAKMRSETKKEQDRQELAEEAEAKMILRNKIIEPYFRSELGTVFLKEQSREIVTLPTIGTDQEMLKKTGDGKDKSSSHKEADSSQEFSKSVHKEKLTKRKISGHFPTSSMDAPHMSSKVPKDTHDPKVEFSYQAKRSNLLEPTVSRIYTMRNFQDNNFKQMGLQLPTSQLSIVIPHNASNWLDMNEAAIRRMRASISSGTGASDDGGPTSHSKRPWNKLKTTSMAAATPEGHLKLSRMRGLLSKNTAVDFGTLREGQTYSQTLTLQNTGYDACRFKVRQPPSSSGLKVGYPAGPVAAGMSVDLNLELYAIASGVEEHTQDGKYFFKLQVVTERDFFEVPVVATILTAEEYDNPTVAPDIPRQSFALHVTKKHSNSNPVHKNRLDSGVK